VSEKLTFILLRRRKADHETANAERKLTPAQKKEKNARKLKEDCTAGVCVAVYRWDLEEYDTVLAVSWIEACGE
jgi:hypothetical protein